MYFTYATIKEEECISLLAEEIKSCNLSNNKIRHLKSTEYIQYLNQISSIPEFEIPRNHEGNNAIIMIEYLADYPRELSGLQKFNQKYV